MELSSHYYAMLALCRVSGFAKESARRIAHASQYVDDATVNHITLREKPHCIHDTVHGRPSFFGIATCHSYSRLKTFHYYSMIHNTCAFHFVPGCRGESFTRKMRCRQSSPVIEHMLKDALKENDPVLLGVLFHVYADSFSHQGFSGLLAAENDIRNLTPVSGYIRDPWEILTDAFGAALSFLSGIVKSGIYRIIDRNSPPYGHLQALGYPDLPYMRWSYEYDASDSLYSDMKTSGIIDNRERYGNAFRSMASYMERFLELHPVHKDGTFGDGHSGDILNDFYSVLVKECHPREKIRLWRLFLIQKNLFAADDPALTYDPNLWLRQAFMDYSRRKYENRRVDNAVPCDSFSETDWYRYYLAVKWYKKRFFHTCSKYGLEIPV